jgi:8-oxo-dGTP diphosphatase
MNKRFTMVVAVHLILLKGDGVLLARRYNTGYEDGNFSVPAGHVDENESCSAAVIREAHEEVGIIIKPADLTLTHTMHRITTRESIDLFYACKQWEGQPSIQEPDKSDQLKWYALHSLPTNTIEYVQHALTCIEKKQPYSEFGWLSQR